ncbi:hypothetical protein Q8F55_003347 [Vanrija albida]|uniref:UBP-type domain-containing protein n=1 Tax=Vanrija albida TaxID=181172 RepID=A0ABR3Q3N7_9TREE
MGNWQSGLVAATALKCAEGCTEENCSHSKFGTHGLAPAGPGAVTSINSYATASENHCAKHAYIMIKDASGVYQCYFCSMEHGTEHDIGVPAFPLSAIRSATHGRTVQPTVVSASTQTIALGRRNMGSTGGDIGLAVKGVVDLKKEPPIKPVTRQGPLPPFTFAEQYKRLSRDDQIRALDLCNGHRGDAHYNSMVSLRDETPSTSSAQKGASSKQASSKKGSQGRRVN